MALRKVAVGRRIRNLRHDAGLTIKQVNSTIRIARSTYGDIERGKRMPNLDQAYSIAALFKTDMQYLATGMGLTRELRTPLDHLRNSK